MNARPPGGTNCHRLCEKFFPRRPRPRVTRVVYHSPHANRGWQRKKFPDTTGRRWIGFFPTPRQGRANSDSTASARPAPHQREKSATRYAPLNAVGTNTLRAATRMPCQPTHAFAPSRRLGPGRHPPDHPHANVNRPPYWPWPHRAICTGVEQTRNREPRAREPQCSSLSSNSSYAATSSSSSSSARSLGRTT